MGAFNVSRTSPSEELGCLTIDAGPACNWYLLEGMLGK
jgi:hypothetical protein